MGDPMMERSQFLGISETENVLYGGLDGFFISEFKKDVPLEIVDFVGMYYSL